MPNSRLDIWNWMLKTKLYIWNVITLDFSQFQFPTCNKGVLSTSNANNLAWIKGNLGRKLEIDSSGGCKIFSFQKSKSDPEKEEEEEDNDDTKEEKQKGGLTKSEQRTVNYLVQKQVQGSKAFRRQQHIKSAKEGKKSKFAKKKTKSKRDKHFNPMKNTGRKWCIR